MGKKLTTWAHFIVQIITQLPLKTSVYCLKEIRGDFKTGISKHGFFEQRISKH